MSAPPFVRSLRIPTSLRAKLVVIVTVGVLVPLVLIATWTTRRIARTGEELLRGQLDASLAVVERTIERNWEQPRGELMLLAENGAVQHALGSTDIRLSDSDARFLEDAYRVVQTLVDEVVFLDAVGAARWRVGPDPMMEIRTTAVASTSPRPQSRLGAVAVDFPITDGTTGRQVGVMTALLRLAALVPAAPLVGPADATLEIADSRTGASLVRREASGSDIDPRRGVGTDAGLLTVGRELRALPLRLVTRAAVDPYVTPFQQSARRGVLVLSSVLLGTCAVAALVTARATRSLEQLVRAAEEVARGNLEYQVPVPSGDEIGRLATAFNSMTQDLRRMLREASQRDALAAVGQFAAELAHEVRNPLTSVRLDLQRLEERMANDARTRDVVRRMLSAVDRLNRTVTGTLRVARSGSIALRPLQLGPALLPAFEAVIPALASRDISLEQELGTVSSVWLNGDADALTQLFTNLLFNAAEAIDRSGRITVSAAQENGTITVRIADSGPGIPPDVMRQLEEPFQTTKRGGTGLGLTISRRIAAAHGGRLDFDCAVERGAAVLVRFPVAKSAVSL